MRWFKKIQIAKFTRHSYTLHKKPYSVQIKLSSIRDEKKTKSIEIGEFETKNLHFLSSHNKELMILQFNNYKYDSH